MSYDEDYQSAEEQTFKVSDDADEELDPVPLDEDFGLEEDDIEKYG